MNLERACKLGFAYDEFIWRLRGVLEAMRTSLFGGYYRRLVAQAHELYRVSDIYKERAMKYGLEFARRISDSDIDTLLSETSKWPWSIRWRLVRDEVFGRPVTTYMYQSRWINRIDQ